MGSQIIDNVTVIVLVRNEELIIDLCLKNLKKYFSNIIVIDMESTDNTVGIAKTFDVEVLSHPIIDNFDSARNIGIKAVETDWIFINDADEFITEDLADQIRLHINESEYDILKIPRGNIHLNKYMTSLSPEYLPRVFKRDVILFNELDEVKLHSFYSFKEHSKTLNCQFNFPDNCLLHFSNLEIENLITKINLYTTTESILLTKTLFKNKIVGVLFAGIKSFLITFFKKKAYKDRYKGFLWSFFDAIYSMLIIIKYYELNENSQKKLNNRERFISCVKRINKTVIVDENKN